MKLCVETSYFIAATVKQCRAFYFRLLLPGRPHGATYHIFYKSMSILWLITGLVHTLQSQLNISLLYCGVLATYFQFPVVLSLITSAALVKLAPTAFIFMNQMS